MLYQIGLLLLGFDLFLPSAFAQPKKPAKPVRDREVKVIAEPRYYVAGAPHQEQMQFFQKPDPKLKWKVTGFVLEIVSPATYAGQIISMHHDGMLASGDPYKLWEVGRRYDR